MQAAFAIKSCSTEQAIRGVAHESQDYHGLYRMQAKKL